MVTSGRSGSWRSDLAWYLGLVLATGAAFAMGGGVRAGLLAAAGMLGFTVVLAVGRRWIDPLRVLGGAGDERNQELYTRSLAAAGGVLGLAVTGWFLVGVARSQASGEMLVLTLLFAATFASASIYHSLRG